MTEKTDDSPKSPNDFKSLKIDDIWKGIKSKKFNSADYEKHALKEVAFFAYHFEGESKSEIGRCIGITRETASNWIAEVEKSVVLEEDLKSYIDKTVVRAEALYQKLLSKRRYSEAWRVWKDLIELLQSFGKVHKEADKTEVTHRMTLKDFRESKEEYDRKRALEGFSPN